MISYYSRIRLYGIRIYGIFAYMGFISKSREKSYVFLIKKFAYMGFFIWDIRLYGIFAYMGQNFSSH